MLVSVLSSLDVSEIFLNFHEQKINLSWNDFLVVSRHISQIFILEKKKSFMIYFKVAL